MITTDIAKLASDGAREELARRGLLDFASFVYPGFETPPHVRYIADLLEKLERGEIRRLCVALPVRHGKSVLCSQIFPAWFMGRHPSQNIILASHSESLATLHSRVAKHLVQDDRWPFVDVGLSTDSASVQRWNVTTGGGMYAIGVGGAITGRGANLLIVDDALHDGLSETERDSAWRWFREVAVPRLEPGGRVLVVNARFAPDDLTGRIEESEDAREWKFVSLPAIAEERDPLRRKIGSALWPERMSVAELESRRVAMGSYAFSAQFQQNPLPAEGNLFKTAWFEHRYKELPRSVRETVYRGFRGQTEVVRETQDLTCVAAVDCASKVTISSDFSAIVVVATDGRDYYVVDVVRERLEFADLLRKIVEVYGRHKPRLVYCEEASSGIPIVQEMRRTTGIPIVGVPPRGSKLSRAEAASALFEAGRIHLPDHAAWIDAYITEFTRFPGGKNDDMVDATSLAINSIQETIEQRAKTTWIIGPADLGR